MSVRKRKVRLPAPDPHAITLTFEHLALRLDMAPATLYRLRASDSRFPRPIKFPGCDPKWLVADVEAYVALVARESREAVA